MCFFWHWNDKWNLRPRTVIFEEATSVRLSYKSPKWKNCLRITSRVPIMIYLTNFLAIWWIFFRWVFLLKRREKNPPKKAQLMVNCNVVSNKSLPFLGSQEVPERPAPHRPNNHQPLILRQVENRCCVPSFVFKKNTEVQNWVFSKLSVFYQILLIKYSIS